MITLSGIFSLCGHAEGTCLQSGENVHGFRLNNPKVLLLAAVNTTSKAFRF